MYCRLTIVYICQQESEVRRDVPDLRNNLPPLPASQLADIGSYESLGKVRSWLDGCGNDHKYCTTSTNTANAPYFPTRVIDVRNIKSGVVALRDKEEVLRSNFHGIRPEGAYPEYWTLSHRWGDPKKVLQLLRGNPENETISNERHFRDGITLEELSPTFRDAMEVVDKLGYRYIWIDSLCIFQDSSSDWEQEARMMKDVYGNSFCNISAIRSSYDASLGLFGPRLVDIGLLFPFSVDMELAASGDCQPEKRKWNFWYDSLWVDEINKAPLSSRGWVVQERFLARRTIHFTRNQIYWECLEHSRCEVDPDGQLGFLDLKPYLQAARQTREYKASLRTIIKHLHPNPEARWSREEAVWHGWATLQGCWRTIVTAYSSCHLTQEADRLIAISGVAKKFREVEDVRYLAGLWERGLHTDLMWRSTASEGVSVRRSKTFAPSWSWASICGGSITVDILNPRGSGEPSSLIELIDARIKPKSHNDDTMGLLESAELDIECRLHYYRKVGKSKWLEMYADQALSERLPQYVESESLSLDTEELVHEYKQDAVIEGVCVPVYSEYTSHGGFSVKCLLLNNISESTYRRVGVLFWSGIGGSWDRAVRTHITLV